MTTPANGNPSPGVPTPPSEGSPGTDPSGQPPDSSAGDSGPDTGAQETFPASYVRELRTESAGYRTRAQHADALAHRLVTELARATGRMADPTDLPYDDSLLGADGFPDPEKVTAAVDDLIACKPHLADRRPRGSIDQGPRNGTDDVDLAQILRARAG